MLEKKTHPKITTYFGGAWIKTQNNSYKSGSKISLQYLPLQTLHIIDMSKGTTYQASALKLQQI